MTASFREGPLAGLTVLERGWLSSNNILIHAQAADEPGAVLVDTGHVLHAEQTLALVRRALAGAPLARIVNTHLHSDHCGGNAVLQNALGAGITIPPGLAQAVREWQADRLGHDSFGQRCRFTFDATIAAGEHFIAGGRRWDAIAAPGHDPHSLIYFDAEHGVLLSADALWENGFGIVFPELVGESGFDEVAATLETIAALPVKVVVPGHGAPFTDVAAALARARSRLSAYASDPVRHARHAVKVVIKYRLMEAGEMPLADLLRWAAEAPIVGGIWDLFGERLGGERSEQATGPAGRSALVLALTHELAGAGALALTAQGSVRNR